jgi:acyl carrier protein
MSSQSLTFEGFCEELGAAFQVPPGSLAADTRFIDDLGFDSLRMLHLGALFERLQVDMPDDLAWEITTIGDAYGYYARHVLPSGVR